MSRQTDNKKVVKVLSNALTAFLDDQRAFAHEDPEWLEEFKGMSQDEREKMPGCGCEDCQYAGMLRGSIFYFGNLHHTILQRPFCQVYYYPN
jgi:hypothetical protein